MIISLVSLQLLDVKIHIEHRWSLTHIYLCCWPLLSLGLARYIIENCIDFILPCCSSNWVELNILILCADWPFLSYLFSLLSCLLFFLLSCLMHDAKSEKNPWTIFELIKLLLSLVTVAPYSCWCWCYCWVNMEFTFHTQTSSTLIFKSWTFVLFVPEKSNFIWWQHFLLLQKRAEPILLSFSKYSTETLVPFNNY